MKRAALKNTRQWLRDPHEWYVEESRASDALFDVERFVGGIWDPACGRGNIVEAARSAGYTGVIGSDLIKRVDAPWHIGDIDFLNAPLEPFPGSIVTNPPFYRGQGTERFIRRAIGLGASKVAVFVSLSFLAGHKRATGLFVDHPPARVYVITPRVSCPPGEWLLAGNKAGGGAEDWCWMVFDQTTPRMTTTFHWLDTKALA